MKWGGKSKTAEERAAANRAEELRKKRTERSQKRVSEATQRSAHPVRVRPVVMRSGEFGTPIHQRTAKKAPRHAFYVTMDRAAGSELRLPAIPALNPGWRLLSGLIAIAALFGMFSMWNSEMFRITTVEVLGLQRISAEEINQLLKLEQLSIVEVDTRAVNEQITDAFPELVGLRVNVGLPNTISMSASERQPVIAWQKGDTVQWLDEEGVIFPARGEAGPLITLHTEDDLPRATIVIDPKMLKTAEAEGGSGMAKKVTDESAGEKTARQRVVDPALVLATKSLSQQLPADVELVYSSSNGLGWIDQQGWQVYIGTDLQNFKAKYNLYQNLAKFLNDQGLKPVLVSVEHLNAPFYRLEP